MFYLPIKRVLDRLAATLTVKTVKIKAFGAEVELAPEQAKEAIDELIQEISELTNELSPEEAALFYRIHAYDGRMTVQDLFPGFARGSPEHRQLQKLRDTKLIRPVEGSQRQKAKHPLSTGLGQVFFKLRNSQPLAG